LGLGGLDRLTTLNLAADSQALAGSSGIAIRNNEGNSILNAADGAIINGQVLLGDGSDEANLNGATALNTITLLDGGDDTSSADGMIDVLNLNGVTATANGGNLINWEVINLNAGSNLSFGPTLKVGVDGDDVAEPGMGLFVEQGSTLRAAGGLALTGNLNNNGLVTTVDGAVGDQVQVSGSLSGVGTLAFDVDLANDTADTLLVQGDLLPGSQITVTVEDVGGSGNGVAVPLVIIDGENQGSFTLAGGPIESGAWTYDLLSSATQVSLSAQVNALGAVYESAPGALLQGLARLPTLEQRVGQRQWVQRAGEQASASQRREGLWLRVDADDTRLRPDQSTSASQYKSRSWGIQGGVDAIARASEQGHWILGLTAQYQRTKADISNTLGQGQIKADGYGVGVSATWYGHNGSYLDAQLQANRTQSDYSTATHGTLAQGQDADTYAASVEAGYRHVLDAKRTLVPQAQLSWGHLQGISFTDSRDNEVRIHSTDRTIGRLGLAYEYRPDGDKAPASQGQRQGQGQGQEKMIYGIVNLVHDFSSASRVDVSGTQLQARGERTWAELGVGGSVNVSKNTVLYGQATYKTALGSNTSGNHGAAGTVGLRVSW
jgi:fibronectin-binding autotransporter adhesin